MPKPIIGICMVTPTIFLLSINCKKKKRSIFNTRKDAKAEKSSNALQKSIFLDVL